MNEKKEIIIVGILIVFILGAGFGLSYYLGKRDETEPETHATAEENKAWADAELAKIPGYENYKKVVLVGKEYLFEDDIKHYLSMRGRLDESGDAAVQKEVLDELANQSVVLQEGEKQGWIKLESGFFNNPLKDYDLRTEKWFTVFEQVNGSQLEGVQFEGVAVFFVNVEATQIVKEKGREYARELVYSKVKDVYDDVKKGNLSMKEAGDILDADEELKTLSPTGKLYSYSPPSLLEAKDIENIKYPLKKEAFEKTKVNKLSDLMLLQEDKTNPSKETEIYWDGYYGFYRILERNSAQVSSFDEWMQRIKVNYTFEYF
ncbi:MAG: hypothetical protein ABIE03_03230 [Patescibacteria group bacterium]|nr:hypothetical protein [Patescibacteria group bacterium]